jgi:hypothetical protein
MVAASKPLVAALAIAEQRLAFPLADLQELRLLDRQDAPLALLGTALPDAPLETGSSRDWDAGGRGERPFVSPLLTERGAPGHDGSGRRHQVDAVEGCMMQAAARSARVQWFRFDAGMAVPLDPVAPSQPMATQSAGPGLDRSAFAPVTVRFDWPEEADRRLFDQYRSWLAPYLLGLSDPTDSTRIELERAAGGHAQLADGIPRLYPRFLDKDLYNRIRVGARLRHRRAKAPSAR